MSFFLSVGRLTALARTALAFLFLGLLLFAFLPLDGARFAGAFFTFFGALRFTFFRYQTALHRVKLEARYHGTIVVVARATCLA